MQIRHRLLSLKISDTVGLQKGFLICISNMFSNEADAAGPGTILWDLLFYVTSSVNPSNSVVKDQICLLPDLFMSVFFLIWFN